MTDLTAREVRLEKALIRLLSWWPEGSERSQAGRIKGSAFAADLAFARSALPDAPERDGGANEQ